MTSPGYGFLRSVVILGISSGYQFSWERDFGYELSYVRAILCMSSLTKMMVQCTVPSKYKIWQNADLNLNNDLNR